MHDREVSASAHQQGLFVIERVPTERHSPKRPRVETAGMADVFPYYAGFSFDWACAQLRAIDGDSAVVLDPWNGSGTTTLAAQACGHSAVGVDLNPVANIIAQLRVNVREGAKLCEPPDKTNGITSRDDDPLSAWLTPITARRFRQWDLSLQQKPPSESALGRVALFRVIRQVTTKYEGSNPTWVRRASADEERIHMGDEEVDELLLNEQGNLLSKLSGDLYRSSPALIITGSANALPLANRSVDAIITSPPYLTRIDYAVAYSRELAILGTDISTDRTLRSNLMGTTLIRPISPKATAPYGRLAEDLVSQVASHPSKASSGYYLKQFRQYLDDLTTSLSEVSRVAKPGAPMVLVVQDSYYKDVPIGLASICIEEAQMRGWVLEDSEPFEVNRLLTQLNKYARNYPKGKVSETVIKLRRS